MKGQGGKALKEGKGRGGEREGGGGVMERQDQKKGRK
jgi:hypothetical protein